MRFTQTSYEACDLTEAVHNPAKAVVLAEMFIPPSGEIWNSATCSTYVNCTVKQLFAFRGTLLRFTPRLRYTTSWTICSLLSSIVSWILYFNNNGKLYCSFRGWFLDFDLGRNDSSLILLIEWKFGKFFTNLMIFLKSWILFVDWEFWDNVIPEDGIS